MYVNPAEVNVIAAEMKFLMKIAGKTSENKERTSTKTNQGKITDFLGKQY